MSGRKRWNNSALWLLETCGEAFRREYIECDRRPGSSAMKRGTAVHTVAAEAHRRQFEAKKLVGADWAAQEVREAALPSIEEAEDLAASEFDALAGEGTSFAPEELKTGEATVLGREKDNAVSLAGLYIEAVAPQVDPVAIERYVEVLPADMDVIVHGTMDLVDQATEGEIIRDLKTSLKAPAKDIAASSQQLTFYHMLRTAETGVEPVGVGLDYVIRRPSGLAEAIRYQDTRGPADVGPLIERLNTAIDAASAGVFVPGVNSWKCSPKWCGFYSDCRFVNAARRRG